MRSANTSVILLQKYGSGTMTWTGTNVPNANYPDQLGTPITIGGGTMIWKTADLVGGSAGNPNIVHTGTLFKYDAPVGVCTISGSISGTGPIDISAGTLTLSGQNTIIGNWTLSGGTLIAGSTEAVGVSGPLGQGGTISFTGGTLAFSPNNTFDYSPRFSTAGGQAYSFDTAGQEVAFAIDLASSGGTLTKLGSGTLTLAGTSSFSGLTTVSGGTLTFQGSKTGTGDITVTDSATLGVFSTGTQVTPGMLTLGTSAGANLEYNNVTSTTSAPLAPATIASAGTTLISISSGTFSVGVSYPLLTWTSGSAPAVSLGNVNGADGTLSTNGNKIQFKVTAIASAWNGTTSGNWTDPSNWIPPGIPSMALFDDTATGTTSVIVDAPVLPTSVTVHNSAKTYTIASGGVNNIGGSTGLTKIGSGTLTLSGGANTYTGVTTIGGGTVSVGALAVGGAASDIGAASSAAANLVFDGGALRYTGGGASIDRLFTLGFGGGTIDSSGSGALTLNNPGTINLSGELTLSGGTPDANMLAGALINSGGLSKSGTGTWILTGTNSYGGGTTIADGMLQVGAGGATGSLGIGNVTNNSVLNFYRTGTVTVSGSVSGSGSLTKDGTGTVILANDNSYSGGTTINAGTLQVGNGGASGSLNPIVPILNNSLLIFNTSGSFTYGAGAFGAISGTGNLIVTGGGFIKAIGDNTYTGWTRIDPNTTFQPRQGQDGSLVSSVVTNNGTLRIVSQNADFTYSGPIRGSGKVQIGASAMVGTSTLTGTNTYTGGTFIEGATLVLGDSVTPASGSILGNVQFVISTIAQDSPRTLVFNRPDDYSPGFTVQNDLAVDGSVTVTFVAAPGSQQITVLRSGGNLSLSWPAVWTGLYLQTQSRAISLGLSTNWVTIPGTYLGNSFLAPISVNSNVFYRLTP